MDATSSVKKENMSLEDQHNPLMNELLISIINIIELVCKEAVGKNKKSKKFFNEISEALNKQEREKHLFK